MSFVKIDRPLDAQAASIRTQSVPGADDANQSFYLALNKKELGRRWFMSAYLKQFFPGAVLGGAAMSLGTRVVTFRVQNGKLFVFDASDNYKGSDTFDPTLIIEAYPIVNTYGPFNQLSNADKYVLFDPAAGLNRFGVVADMFAWDPSAAANFQVDVAYMQRFRGLSDGVTYEQVFTGSSSVFPINDGTQTGNVFRASGTLGLALRKYAEGQSYTPTELQEQELYFRSDPHLVPNSGMAYQTAAKWNIHKGMRPITWLISDQFNEVQKQYPQYDVIGAVKRGITNWNEVLGFDALEVEVARPDDSYADDDKNYLIYDGDPTFGAAFANWRTNPNTGEIRGASVYFNAIWLMIADSEFSDDAAPNMRPAGGLVPMARPKTPSLTWGTWKTSPLCVLWADNFRPQDDVPAPGAAMPNLTKKQKVENFLTHVIIHEIGHTLGLRHNFKGSNGAVGGSTSVMEYILDDDAVAGGRDKAGPYDVAAIKFLYGLGTELPTQPFCTDEDTAIDPDCNRFDRGADPLVDYFGPSYAGVLNAFLTGQSPIAPNTTLNSVLKYDRAAVPSARRVQAWNLAIKGLQVPADPTKVQSVPGYGARVDVAARRLLSRLYLDDASLRGDFTADPATDAQLTPLILAELKGNLLNTDKIRTYSTRRAMVDVLKKMQSQAAYNVLLDARTAIAAQLSGLSGDDLANTKDLLARIDAATKPYFN